MLHQHVVCVVSSSTVDRVTVVVNEGGAAGASVFSSIVGSGVVSLSTAMANRYTLND